jgi:hypothetical protein
VKLGRWRTISKTRHRIIHASTSTKNARFAIGQKRSVAARMSLPLPWREWAIQLMRYGVRFIDIGHMGQSDATLLSHGDEDDRASEREPLTSAPAISERRHRSFARPEKTISAYA